MGGWLFPPDEPLPPFARDSDTSLAAAKLAKPNVATVRGEVYRAIMRREATGATCDEIEELLILPHQSASARIWELAGKNLKADLLVLIADSGRRRRTRSGRQAVVWIALEFQGTKGG